MISRVITDLDEYNALKDHVFSVETITFEWTPRYVDVETALNVVVTYRLYNNSMLRLRAVFYRVENIRMDTPFCQSDEVTFLLVEENVKDANGKTVSKFGVEYDFCDSPFRAFEVDEHEPDLRFEFEEFHAVLEDYTIKES